MLPMRRFLGNARDWTSDGRACLLRTATQALRPRFLRYSKALSGSANFVTKPWDSGACRGAAAYAGRAHGELSCQEGKVFLPCWKLGGTQMALAFQPKRGMVLMCEYGPNPRHVTDAGVSVGRWPLSRKCTSCATSWLSRLPVRDSRSWCHSRPTNPGSYTAITTRFPGASTSFSPPPRISGARRISWHR